MHNLFTSVLLRIEYIIITIILLLLLHAIIRVWMDNFIMIDLPRILNSKRVMATVPSYLKGPHPVVSYTYTRTIAGKIFNTEKW